MPGIPSKDASFVRETPRNYALTVQKSIGAIFEYLSSLSDGTSIDPTDILFGIRLVTNISIDRMFDVIFSKEGSADFVLEALKIYCERKKEK